MTMIAAESIEQLERDIAGDGLFPAANTPFDPVLVALTVCALPVVMLAGRAQTLRHFGDERRIGALRLGDRLFAIVQSTVEPAEFALIVADVAMCDACRAGCDDRPTAPS